jgi:uroporphyrinogen-III decarboxylase
MLTKRERVLRTLELEEPDLVPIHSLGYEPTRQAARDFWGNAESQKYKTAIPDIGDITEIRWWNADIWQMDPFCHFTSEFYPSPPEYPDCVLHFSGRLYRKESTLQHTILEQKGPDIALKWYVDGYFKTPDIIHQLWATHGKPSERINPNENYSRSKWQSYVERLSPYVFPMAWLTLSMNESLFEGMTMGRLGHYIRKRPTFIHELMEEYCRTNLELAKRFIEAGVEVIFYSDDLGQKDRGILSLPQFREFVLPYYRRLYQLCKNHGVFVVQHTCGFIEEYVPDLIDAGLSCMQSLEPAAGVDLGRLKAQYGTKLAFMGGIDSSRVLSFGTPAAVEQEVKRCIDAAATHGGYFVGPSHTLLDVPWENVCAMRAAIEKYRSYPRK